MPTEAVMAVVTEAVTTVLTTPHSGAKNNFETKQSTICDNSYNNQLAATKKQ